MLSLYPSLFKFVFYITNFRPSQHGATAIWGRPAQASRTSTKTSAMAWSWCCCWKSFPARHCPSPTAARCVSTRSLTLIRHWTSLPPRVILLLYPLISFLYSISKNIIRETIGCCVIVAMLLLVFVGEISNCFINW